MPKLPKWAPAEPKHTCLNIDAMQAKLRDQADELVRQAEELRNLANELEELRTDNIRLRDWGKDVAYEGEWQIDLIRDELDEAKKEGAA